MRFIDSLRFRFATMFHRSQLSAEVSEEIRSHVQLRADDLERAGVPRAEAERRARIEFGGREKYKEECAEAAGGNFFETLMQDFRFSIRVLRKSPGFTIAAILTLALAIGANAVVFSVMNAFILRPLNVPDTQSLYAIFHSDSPTEQGTSAESYPNYLDLQNRNRGFDGLASFQVIKAALDTGKDPTEAWIYETTGNYFDVLRLHPYLGRYFHRSDEHGANSAPYIVLSYAYWHTHFRDDRGVVGRIVQLNQHPFTILGVSPPNFNGTLMFFNPDFFIPIVNHTQLGGNDLNDRGNDWIFMTIGHLKAGVSQAQAIGDLNSIGAYLAKTYPKDDGKLTYNLGRPNLYGDYLGRPVRIFMSGLMLLAGLILLAACANLGGLFAARAADRSREVALRLALGSSRRRILRGLFTEALFLSIAGGALGLLGGVVLLRGLSTWQPFPAWPIHLGVNPDANVYGVALLLTLVSGFLFGAVPVRQVLHTNPYEVVKAGSAGRVGRRISVRDILLVLQIAICAVLITSSMVAVRGLTRSLHANFGFEMQNRMLVETDLSMAGYSVDRMPAMQKQMIDAVKAIPGVESVGLADMVPLGDGANRATVFADNTSDLRPANAAANPVIYKISPEYFSAAGTVLLAGRAFTWHDDKNSPRVAVVNGQFARGVFGSVDKAMGRYFRQDDGTRVQVVGVAANGKYTSLTGDPEPVIFLPLLQLPSSSTYMTVHSNRDLQQLGEAIRSTLRNLAPGLPVEVQKRAEGVDSVMFGPRMATMSLGVLGIMGAMLSITGIFGMAAYSVSKRLRELGIRMALGAQRKEVLQAALGRPLRLLAFGSAAGLILGLLASRLLAYIVSEATARDPLVMAGVVLVMLLLGLVATWIPAQRALSVDPLRLLREE